MEGCLEEVALAWVFRVEEFEKVEDERLVNIALGEVGVEVWAFNEAEEEFVDDLEVGPGELEDGFVFFWVEGVTCWVDRWGYRSEEVGGKLPTGSLRGQFRKQRGGTDHVDDLGVYILSNDSALSCDIFQHLVEGLSLDLLSFKFGAGVVEIEQYTTLVEFLDK